MHSERWWFNVLSVLAVLTVVSTVTRCAELDNWFDSEEKSTSLNNGDEESELEQSEEEVKNKGSRDESADVEVILGWSPMISPDIIVGKFTDSKVSVHEAVLEATKHLTENGTKVISRGEEPDVLENSDVFDNEVEDRSSGAGFNYESEIRQIKRPKSGGPCLAHLNGTSGAFEFNFDDDCTVLITSPNPSSRVVLHCEEMRLPNCSAKLESVTVNLKGDRKFGRNSYFYCSKSQIRTTAIRRKLALRVKKTEGVDQRVRCHFFARQQRLFPFKSESGLSASSGALCGRLGRSSKIVGGKKVPPGLFPWVVQLDITRFDGSQTACTGSLISEKFVLTAAHCLKNAESVSAYMGGADRLEFTGVELTIQAEKYILHRRWNAKTLTADIALVKLSEPVKFTEEVSPICLQQPESLLGLGLIRRESWAGKNGVAVGWGRLTTKQTAPRRLYRVKLPFLTDRECQRVYSAFYQKRSMLCTDSTTKAAICYGDSGGPLMYKRNDIVYQVGVASFSLSRTCGASPDVFTKVSEYASWIKTRVKADP